MDIYMNMLDYNETWYVTLNGYSMLINDTSLMDC